MGEQKPHTMTPEHEARMRQHPTPYAKAAWRELDAERAAHARTLDVLEAIARHWYGCETCECGQLEKAIFAADARLDDMGRDAPGKAQRAAARLKEMGR